MGLLARFRDYLPVRRAAEGEYRPGPYFMEHGWLPANAGKWWNFWQMGYDVQPYDSTSAMVEACISAYAQTIAMCPGDHWRTLPNGGRERIANSALTRILRRPNQYQTISDFLLNLTWSMYDEGNGIALALRNDRFEIQELHLMDSRRCRAQIAENGEVFYDLAGNEIVEKSFGGLLRGVPARDVLHVRLRTRPGKPLVGISPIMATALDMAASNAAMQQQLSFFANQARPSFILTTDRPLSVEEAVALRESWVRNTTGENAGRTPIVGWGVKPHQVAGTAVDAQLAETLKMSDQRIALAFRLPLQILGLGGGAPQGSTEALMNNWLASGLGFCLNHLEEAIGLLFRLKGQPEEYLEFNTRALLRSSFKDHIDALVRATQGGVLAVNEARNDVDRPSVLGGDEPRVQQQLVPLSYGLQMQPPEPRTPLPPEPERPDPEPVDQEPDAEPEAEKLYSIPDVARRIYEQAGLTH